MTIIIGLVVLGGVSPGEARVHQKKTMACLPGRGHVLIAGNEAQVYVAKDALGAPQLYGCVYGRHATVELGSEKFRGSEGRPAASLHAT